MCSFPLEVEKCYFSFEMRGKKKKNETASMEQEKNVKISFKPVYEFLTILTNLLGVEKVLHVLCLRLSGCNCFNFVVFAILTLTSVSFMNWSVN